MQMRIFILQIPSYRFYCKFHHADSIMRIPLYGFYCADSIVQISSCGFHCADSIVHIPSYRFHYYVHCIMCLPSCAFHHLHSIMCLPFCVFYCIHSIVRLTKERRDKTGWELNTMAIHIYLCICVVASINQEHFEGESID